MSQAPTNYIPTHPPPQFSLHWNNAAHQPVDSYPHYPAPSAPEEDTYHIDTMDLSSIEAIDLTTSWSNRFKKRNYLLLLIPVIGWVALASLKFKHQQVKSKTTELFDKDDYRDKNTADKIETMEKLIEIGGPLKDKYRLELARLQLLSGNADEAFKTSKSFLKKQIFVKTEDGCYVLVYTRSYEQAMIFARIFEKNDHLSSAYDFYDEAIVHNEETATNEIKELKFDIAKKLAGKEDVKLSYKEKQIIFHEADKKIELDEKNSKLKKSKEILLSET